MNSTEIHKMADMEGKYWWHIGKKHLVTSLIKHHFNNRTDLKILELGCGTGGMLGTLARFGEVTGFDISPVAVDYCRAKGFEAVRVQDISTINVSGEHTKYNLVLALDVLEHIQDDVLAMQKVHTLLANDGLFFVNVPAHKFLWSEHDEALEHKRRYHRVELIKKLTDAGFDIVSNSYFVSFISPIIILYRIWSNVFGKSAYPKTSYVLLPKKLNAFFVSLLKLESRLMLKMRIPFGVTLNVVAKKAAV